MDKKFDVTFDFTTDTPNYWECFYAGENRPDPDANSPTMRQYQQILYSKTLPNGENFELKQGNSSDKYLCWKDFCFGSDSIINMYIHHRTLKTLINDVKKEIPDFDKFYEEYLRKSYTIGGEIIFPKYPKSINVARGTNGKIADRFDLTLECIRLYYNNDQSPLYDTLKANYKFFELFVDFKGYVDFFYLNDLVSDDYKSINFYLDFDNFNRTDPRPQTVEEWNILYNRQMDFLNKRNNRIDRTFNK